MFTLFSIITIFIFNDAIVRLYVDYFHQEPNFLNLSLLCIPVFMSVIISLLWGNKGGSVTLLVLAVITIYYTKTGQGPFYLNGLFNHESLWLIQGYLTVTALLLTFLRITTKSIYLPEKKKENKEVKHLIYQLNLSTKKIEWANSSDSFCKVNITEITDMKKILELIIPADREKLCNHWSSEKSNFHLPEIRFKLLDKDNNLLSIEDRGSIVFGDNNPVMIVGNWFFSDKAS